MFFVFFFNTHTANTKPKLLFNLFFDFFLLISSLCFPPFVSPGSARLNVQTQRGVPFCLQRESSFQGLGCVLRNEISGESFFDNQSAILDLRGTEITQSQWILAKTKR